MSEIIAKSSDIQWPSNKTSTILYAFMILILISTTLKYEKIYLSELNMELFLPSS